MRKIKLEVQDLTVETFSTTRTSEIMRGTVHAREPVYTGWSCETWEIGCGGTGFREHTCDNLNSCDTNCHWVCN